MKTKRNNKKHILKWILLLLMSSFFVPSNIQGKSLKANKTTEIDIKLESLNLQQNRRQDGPPDSQLTYTRKDHTIPWAVIILMSTIAIVAPYLNCLWIRFLIDQPLSKQCALNRLCRDLIRANLLYCWIWSVAPTILKLLDSSGCEPIKKEVAHGISLLTEGLLFILQTYLLLVGSLRLYTLRYNVLDPVEECFGKFVANGKCESERFEDIAVTCIRVFFLSLATLMISTMYFGSIKPYSFYRIANYHLTWNNILIGTKVQHITSMILLTLCGIVFLMAKIYQNYKYYRHQVDRFTTEAKQNKSPDRSDNDDPGLQNNDDLTRNGNTVVSGTSFGERVSLPALLYISTGFLAIVVVLLEYVEVVVTNIWWILTPMVGMLGVVIPIALLFRYDDLKEYFRRQMKCDMNEVSRSFQDIISSVRMLKPRVAPLQ